MNYLRDTWKYIWNNLGMNKMNKKYFGNKKWNVIEMKLVLYQRQSWRQLQDFSTERNQISDIAQIRVPGY